jgi:hypothetical protein
MGFIRLVFHACSVLVMVTTNDVKDRQVVGDIIEQVEQPIEQGSTDAAYDHRDCYNQIIKREAKISKPIATKSKPNLNQL